MFSFWSPGVPVSPLHLWNTGILFPLFGTSTFPKVCPRRYKVGGCSFFFLLIIRNFVINYQELLFFFFFFPLDVASNHFSGGHQVVCDVLNGSVHIHVNNVVLDSVKTFQKLLRCVSHGCHLILRSKYHWIKLFWYFNLCHVILNSGLFFSASGHTIS